MRAIKFYVDERHAWLDVSHPDWAMVNIGSDGSNLTVVALSMNRVSLTIRLVKSFIKHVPNFAGRFLLADSGSDAEELAQLESFMATECPFPYDIIAFGSNLGVAGGRNRAFAAVKTDWILSLDNDIYLISNPFPAVSRDLALLGCHFLSVPLINPDLETFYSFGGHLLLTLTRDGTPFLTINTMLPAASQRSKARDIVPDGSGFLCSFLFGGASILRRGSFLEAGGFDDAMLVGFEDIDFSLRLFRSGMKVGSSAVESFVHDHPPAAASADRDYEKIRYSRRTLYESARYLEGKHGFQVWSGAVEDWLVEHERKQGFGAASEERVVSAATSSNRPEARKPRIALVTDTDDWAFANISRQIVQHLGNEFEFEVVATSRLAELPRARWKDSGADPLDNGHGAAMAIFLLRANEFDLVHVFWRPMLNVLMENGWGGIAARYAEFLGLDYSSFRKKFIDGCCFTTSVYDHLYLDAAGREMMAPAYKQWVTAYSVSSRRLERIYRQLPGMAAPSAVTPDGVDPTLFYPKRLQRFHAIDRREIVVGWVGNSKWARELGTDPKGVHTILLPAVEKLQQDGLPLRLHLADRQVRYIPHHEMVDYYASIDILLCTSEIEGTPNPVLEAMACGVPVITTDVGIVPEALGLQQREFILRERSIVCLQEALRRLVNDPDLFHRLSQENLQQAKLWTWEEQTKKFGAFFSSSLARRRRGMDELRNEDLYAAF